MNVLLLTGTYPPAPGYAESRHAASLAGALAAAGHQVQVISADRSAKGGSSEREGVEVHRPEGLWPFFHYDRDSDAVLGSIGILGTGLEGLLSGRRPDLILCYGWPAALAGFVLRERSGSPVIVHFHGTAAGRRGGVPDGAGEYPAEMERWAAQAADAVACPSEAARAEILRFCGVDEKKAFVIPPACDAAQLGPGSTNLGDFRRLLAGDNEFLVLFAGELAPDNGPAALLRALPAAAAAGARVRCVLAGEGESASELMALAAESGVAELCLFTGHVSDRVLGCLYSVCDVLAAPGTYAPSAAAAIECMAHGQPVLGSDTGALSELITDGLSGIKVHPGDPDALAGSLVWLARNRDRMDAMGERAQRTVGERFSWERSAQAFLQVAEKLPGASVRR
jgi:glycosyltransferase involved in cell wall biosynthesis